AQNRMFFVFAFIRDFGMDEDNDRFDNFAFDFLIRDLRQCLRVGFPVETFCLKAEEFHRRCQRSLWLRSGQAPVGDQQLDNRDFAIFDLLSSI
ncbi:MAG TPA: hypothetical protein VNY32_07160, partial [Candidatus Acidoferrales bacterium]|nr:hypothetical protein [Candidatus Acidoferrales bacterium]